MNDKIAALKKQAKETYSRNPNNCHAKDVLLLVFEIERLKHIITILEKSK